MTDRKKPGVAFWAIVVVVAVLIAYPLSLGPTCWIMHDATKPHEVVAPRLYWPLGWIMSKCLASHRISVLNAVTWYIGMGLPKGTRVVMPTYHQDGNSLMFST